MKDDLFVVWWTERIGSVAFSLNVLVDKKNVIFYSRHFNHYFYSFFISFFLFSFFRPCY